MSTEWEKFYDSTEEAAVGLIQHILPGAHILSVGSVHRLNAEGEGDLAGHSVTLDTGGQGQDVHVYEVIFYGDGDGVFLKVAGTYGMNGAEMPKPFGFDLLHKKYRIRYENRKT